MGDVSSLGHGWALDDRFIEGDTDPGRIEDSKLLGAPGFRGQLPIGVKHTLCLILSIELLDVLDVNTATGLLGDRAVRIATEKNFDGIALNDRHLSGLSLFIPGRKTKFLLIEGERGIDIKRLGGLVHVPTRENAFPKPCLLSMMETCHTHIMGYPQNSTTNSNSGIATSPHPHKDPDTTQAS
jgi:hypothetical protein